MNTKICNKKRDISADIIRCFALFLVVSVHFFLHNGFYTQIVEGKRMFVMHIMRALFMLNVPLFLTLSGYLLSKKELSIKYYKRITNIIFTYVMSSLVCMAYSRFFLHQTFSLKMILLKILDFSGAPYSWYIEMYIGLFLMIPFLNILYNNIPSQKWKLVLVFTFIIITILPSALNEYNLYYIDWWSFPALSSLPTNKLIPSYWVKFYPITYYFLGCYLKEYGFKIKKSLNILLIFACILLAGLYTYWRSYKSCFVLGEWANEYSLFNIILTILVFSLITNINYGNVPTSVSKFIQKISGLCLGGYLVSWVFDDYFYPILREKVPDMIYRLEYYFIIVPLVFVLSLLTSYLISKIILLLQTIFGKVFSLFRKKICLNKKV